MKQKLNPAVAAIVVLAAIGIATFVMFKMADRPDDRKMGGGMPSFMGGAGAGKGGPGKGGPGKGAPNQKPAETEKKEAPTKE